MNRTKRPRIYLTKKWRQKNLNYYHQHLRRSGRWSITLCVTSRCHVPPLDHGGCRRFEPIEQSGICCPMQLPAGNLFPHSPLHRTCLRIVSHSHYTRHVKIFIYLLTLLLQYSYCSHNVEPRKHEFRLRNFVARPTCMVYKLTYAFFDILLWLMATIFDLPPTLASYTRTYVRPFSHKSTKHGEIMRFFVGWVT